MASEQLWFFLREDMAVAEYSQVPRTFTELRHVDLTLDYCLEATNTVGIVKDYAFYLQSASMATAVRLLSDDSITATYNLYCQTDAVVTITIRKADDPSPNASRSANYYSSLAERHVTSAKHGLLVPELFIRPKVRYASNSPDISTVEPILDESAMVTLGVNNELFTFTNDYLLGWISAQVADLKDLTEIRVQHVGSDDMRRDVQLTEGVWQQYLIRGEWKNVFGPIWDDYIGRRYEREATLDQISESIPGFRQSCQDFVYDLRTYGANKGAQARLKGTGHEFYLGPPYFSAETRDRLLGLPAAGSRSLETVLRDLSNKRKDSTICASHDLAPIFESVLGVKWEMSSKKATTNTRRSTGGLSLHGTQRKAKALMEKGCELFKNSLNRKGGKK